MGLQIEGKQVDHINRNVNDNRRCNLRIATHSQNRVNSCCANRTGYKGVRVRPNGKRWMAQITVNGQKQYLGNFASPLEAHKAYCLASKAMRGEFHCGRSK